MFLLFQATLPPKELEKVYRDIFMIDFKKIMMCVINVDATKVKKIIKLMFKDISVMWVVIKKRNCDQ